ncbi:hypothetical protein KKF61_05790 [Patescibacteria group bacterium]|nr:hypothetical protein [Patescibacteria group bacterium]MBU0963769.1 hypothetical protein [Patescibacteria group bacterium]
MNNPFLSVNHITEHITELGMILKEEIISDPKKLELQGNILGVNVELPITGQIINIYLIIISIILTIGILLAVAAWHKTSPENDMDDELEDEDIIEI